MRALATAAALIALAVTPARAEEGTVTYDVDGAAYEGFMVEAQGEGSRGLVVIIHDWDGLTEYERTRARMLSRMGYDAFAVDLYGKGNRPDTTEAKKAEVGKLYDDREAMRARFMGGMAQARASLGDADAVVMGYCFGGAATLEVARSGQAEGVAGFATFHGGLSTPEGQDYEAVDAPLMILHGAADASIGMDQVADLTDRLEAAGKDFEIEIYSGAPHAWTVFGSPRYRGGADRKSWRAFTDFLEETLDGA